MHYSMDELLPIVKWLTEKYTGKSSTSITYEKAEQLMGAIIYCIRENGLKDSEYGLRVSRLKAEDAYHAGYELVIKKVFEAKRIYEEVIDTFNSYGVRCCYDTVVEGMPEFFVHYDARFFPQDHILTLDYPLLSIPHQLSGIDIIYEYLFRVQLEQRFLILFPRKFIIEALKAYHKGYEELFINISSIVIRSLLNKMMDGRVFISEESVDTLEDKLISLLSKFIWEECKTRLKDDSFCTEIEKYLRTDMRSFAVELKNMADNYIK